MTTTTTTRAANRRGTLRTLALFETKRFARHPLFLFGAAMTLGLTLWFGVGDDQPGDLLSWPVVPAFFTGVTSVIVAARLTRSSSTAEEALAISPESESTRTKALLLACLVPAAVGVAWAVLMFVETAINKPHPDEWWFGTVPNLDVIAIVLAGGPVACFGGAVVGVMIGRWLRFPGAPAVTMVVLVLWTALGQAPVESHDWGQLRLWTPWASFQSGTQSDHTQTLYSGGPTWYLLYAICLCATACIAALWHDRAARTATLKKAIAIVSIVGILSLTLAMTTGLQHKKISPPIPAHAQKHHAALG